MEKNKMSQSRTLMNYQSNKAIMNLLVPLSPQVEMSC